MTWWPQNTHVSHIPNADFINIASLLNHIKQTIICSLIADDLSGIWRQSVYIYTG